MAIYEYRCATCGHKFEMLVLKDSDRGAEACPACGRKGLEKKVSCYASKSFRKPAKSFPNTPQTPS